MDEEDEIPPNEKSHAYHFSITYNGCHFRFLSLETSAFEELGSELINFACNCVINTLRLIVYLTVLSI